MINKMKYLCEMFPPVPPAYSSIYIEYVQQIVCHNYSYSNYIPQLQQKHSSKKGKYFNINLQL